MRLIKNWLGSRRILIAAVVYSCAMIYLFFMPTSGLPKVGFSGIDKLVHVILFLGLTWLWLFYFLLKRGGISFKFYLTFFLIILGSGILIEVFQELFTDSRTADPFDVVADSLGALLGIGTFKRVKSKFELKE